MAQQHINPERITGGKPNQTLVGVAMNPDHLLTSQLLDRFSDLRWQVIDLNALNWSVPSEMTFAGAMMNCLPTRSIAQYMIERNVPTVRLGRLAHPDDHLMPAIIPDQITAGELAADHFAERGFVHVGFIAYDQWHLTRALFDGFRKRAEAHGCTCHLLTLNEKQMRAEVDDEHDFYDIKQQYVTAWWRTLPRPLGLFASSDTAGYRYGQWAMQASLRVPEDLAILGYGNNVLTCEGAIVPLSSIDLNQNAILDTAINTLSDLIAGESLQQHTITVAPRLLVTRRSTDVLAASDPNVAKALRYMWDHITEDLSVDQIANHVGVSRRTLEVGFRRDIKRGINAEFQRRRLEKGRELLLQTDWQVGHIAEYLGYSGLKAFSKAFRNAFSVSPMQFRGNHQIDH